MVHQRIVAGIEAQLFAKGLRKVESDPDSAVVYYVATDTEVSVNAMGGGPLGGWRFCLARHRQRNNQQQAGKEREGA